MSDATDATGTGTPAEGAPDATAPAAGAPGTAARTGTARALALVMAAALALYVVVAGGLAIGFLLTGTPLSIVVGVALAIFTIVGAWALASELVFGIRLDRAVRALAAEGGMPAPLPATASGRADKAAAEGAFPVAKADVEAHPESWQSWLRLSMAYDAARDRKRARMAARKALELRKTGAQEAR
ncbi:hypothetical protein SAMN04487783_0122 [Agrococcus baldri]|uniref:Tetratricopeptide repeat-containing protein n=1 Tax=Agrococcus baldri TaxID=153730 RepID=A0AA94HJU0_9MICO|nr:hypothetical protein [Agrococcus baldri]SFR97615.1 hypothetical protein SAMN04487783_0122 [Agrococcus baldri]